MLVLIFLLFSVYINTAGYVLYKGLKTTTTKSVKDFRKKIIDQDSKEKVIKAGYYFLLGLDHTKYRYPF